MANGLCDASSRVLFLTQSTTHYYFLPLQYPVYPLFRLLSPALWGSQSFPLPRHSRFPPFSPSRTCVCARAFGLFSCFYAPLVFSLPKYNWRCDAPVSLSLSTLWPPLLPLLSLVHFFWAKTVRPRSLSPRESDFGESLDACRQLANSWLLQTGSANRPISRRLTP